jgi:hypothetical protein
VTPIEWVLSALMLFFLVLLVRAVGVISTLQRRIEELIGERDLLQQRLNSLGRQPMRGASGRFVKG